MVDLQHHRQHYPSSSFPYKIGVASRILDGLAPVHRHYREIGLFYVRVRDDLWLRSGAYPANLIHHTAKAGEAAVEGKEADHAAGMRKKPSLGPRPIAVSAFESGGVLDLDGQSATRWMWSRASSVDEAHGAQVVPSCIGGGRLPP